MLRPSFWKGSSRLCQNAWFNEFIITRNMQGTFVINVDARRHHTNEQQGHTFEKACYAYLELKKWILLRWQGKEGYLYNKYIYIYLYIFSTCKIMKHLNASFNWNALCRNNCTWKLKPHYESAQCYGFRVAYLFTPFKTFSHSRLWNLTHEIRHSKRKRDQWFKRYKSTMWIHICPNTIIFQKMEHFTVPLPHFTHSFVMKWNNFWQVI